MGSECFSWALKLLKAGCKLKRKGWNGKGMWVELQKPDEHSKMTLPYLFLVYSVQAKAPEAAAPGVLHRVPWLASQTDLLATDWEVVIPEVQA